MTRKHLDRVLDDLAHEYYRRLAEGRAPVTTWCAACDRSLFPPRERCPACGGPTAWRELPRSGRLHAFTTQETALRHAAPEVLALVELDGAVLPAILDGPYDALAIGDPVAIEVADEPDVELALLRAVPE